MVTKEYITEIPYEFEGEPRTAYRIAGTRVSLDSVVINWLNGESPEGIVDSFPSLTLEQVYGALAFYLANQEEVDEYLRQGQTDYEKMRQQSWQDLRKNKPLLYQKLFANFISNHDSPGVLLIPQSLPIKQAVEELATIWGASEAEEWVNTITWLPRP